MSICSRGGHICPEKHQAVNILGFVNHPVSAVTRGAKATVDYVNKRSVAVFAFLLFGPNRSVVIIIFNQDQVLEAFYVSTDDVHRLDLLR